MAEIHLNLLSSKYYSLTTSKEDMESKYRESMFLYKTLNNYYSIELSKRNTLLNKKNKITEKEKFDFKPKNRAELIRLVDNIINEFNKNKTDENKFNWTLPIDLDIYDNNLSGSSQKTIRISPEEIKSLNEFEKQLYVTESILKSFKMNLKENNVDMSDLNREQWIYLIADWMIKKNVSHEILTGSIYLSKSKKDYYYDYLINYYEIEVEDIKEMIYRIIEYNEDMKNQKSNDILEEIKKSLYFKTLKEINLLNYYDWIKIISNYFIDNKINNKEIYVFRPNKAKEENMNYTINKYRITSQDLDNYFYYDELEYYDTDDSDMDDFNSADYIKESSNNEIINEINNLKTDIDTDISYSSDDLDFFKMLTCDK